MAETIWRLASFGELDGARAVNNYLFVLTLLSGAAIKSLHSEGKALDEQDDRGFTPLCWAARNGHLPVVTYLVENGCSLEKVDSYCAS